MNETEKQEALTRAFPPGAKPIYNTPITMPDGQCWIWTGDRWEPWEENQASYKGATSGLVGLICGPPVCPSDADLTGPHPTKLLRQFAEATLQRALTGVTAAETYDEVIAALNDLQWRLVDLKIAAQD